MTRRGLVAAFVLVAASASGVAYATTMRALSVVDLTDQADLVVRGRVLGTSDVVTVVDGRLEPRIVTRIAPDEILAGAAPSGEIRVIERGGRARRMVFLTEGTAEFRKGQEVLVFLARVDGGYRPVGHAQGAFVVGRDRRTGDARVRREADPGELVGDAIEKGIDLSANPRLDAIESIVREQRGRAR